MSNSSGISFYVWDRREVSLAKFTPNMSIWKLRLSANYTDVSRIKIKMFDRCFFRKVFSLYNCNLMRFKWTLNIAGENTKCIWFLKFMPWCADYACPKPSSCVQSIIPDTYNSPCQDQSYSASFRSDDMSKSILTNVLIVIDSLPYNRTGSM